MDKVPHQTLSYQCTHYVSHTSAHYQMTILTHIPANLFWQFVIPGWSHGVLVLELIELRLPRQCGHSVYSTRPFCRVVQRAIM